MRITSLDALLSLKYAHGYDPIEDALFKQSSRL